MFLGLISGLVGALFSSTSMSLITAIKKETGFAQFYSYAFFQSSAFAANRCKENINYMINGIMKNAAPSIQSKKDEIIQDLNDISEFEFYEEIKCEKMVSTINYNKNVGQMFIHIHTFSPSMHPTKGRIVLKESLDLSVKMELAKDWMIVTKAKASFFGASVSQEIHYIPNKGIEMKNIVEAIAIALAPAVLGVVKLPGSFINICGSILEGQRKNPNAGVITSPTSAQTEQALSIFHEMEARHKAIVKDSLSKIF